MPCDINIRVSFESQHRLESIFRTLKVETMDKDIRRGQMDVMKEGNDLIVNVSADDLIAARSLSNSILRLLKTSTEVVDIIETDNPN